MLKILKKAIQRQFLKVDWIKLEVEAYKLIQAKKRHHERWAQLMHSGKTVRDLEPKPEPHKTLVTVTDEEVVIAYMDGRMIGQRPVTPTIIRPFGLGRRKQ